MKELQDTQPATVPDEISNSTALSRRHLLTPLGSAAAYLGLRLSCAVESAASQGPEKVMFEGTSLRPVTLLARRFKRIEDKKFAIQRFS